MLAEHEIIEMPKGRLSIEVEFKAKPSPPVKPSPSPEGTIGADIVPPEYSDEQHATWQALYDRQSALIEGRACDEYIEGRRTLNLTRERVPHLRDASAALQRATAWEVVRVAGFVRPDLFLKVLANKKFPCTDFVRHKDELEYTPAPDMFHDLMGHLPMITNPRFASFFHAYGIAGTHTQTQEESDWLARIYWFTVEFGLINPTAHDGANRRDDACRTYGAGLASSVGEIVYCLTDEVKKVPFNIETIANTTYDIHHMQDRLFEISSFDELETEFKRWASEKGLLN